MNYNATYLNKPTYIINNYFNNSDIFITGTYISQTNDNITYAISKSKPNKYTVLLYDVNDDFKSLAKTNMTYTHFTVSLNEMNDFINNIVNKNKKWKVQHITENIEIPGRWTSMTGGYKMKRK
jgi:hypothetical protein